MELPFSPEELSAFIEENQHTHPADVLLKTPVEKREHVKLLLEQMEGRKRLGSKVPEWASRFDLLLPPPANLSQCSNTETAEFKASDITGSLLDLTAGSGIDIWKMAASATSVDMVDPNEELLLKTQFNLQQWGVRATPHFCTAEEFIATNERSFDWIYLDPSRRSDDGSKTVALHRMLPDVPQIWEAMHKTADHVKMKLSPLFDLQAIIRELPYVYRIEVLSKRGEVKEIVVTSSRSETTPLRVEAHELDERRPWQYARPWEEMVNQTPSGDWGEYLYDPGSALIKSGLAHSYAAENMLVQPMANVTLFSSNNLIESYPGRVFKIEAISKPFKNKELPKRLSIVTRNYFDKPEIIRKRLKVGESDTNFLFAAAENRKNAVFIHALKLI